MTKADELLNSLLSWDMVTFVLLVIIAMIALTILYFGDAREKIIRHSMVGTFFIILVAGFYFDYKIRKVISPNDMSSTWIFIIVTLISVAASFVLARILGKRASR